MQNFKSSFESNFETLLALAITLANQAHAGQLDKAGKPYISHPLTVMSQMNTPESKIVAVLHDAIEDSDLTIADLVRQGFPEFITEAIAAITKRDGEPYEDYILRVKSNAIARKVKIADVTHNMNISRIANPTEKDFQRLEKYKKFSGVTTRVKPMSLEASEKQVISKQRVTDHGEVFTNQREVKVMLDLVKQETERIESRFWNLPVEREFLAEVLERKLEVVKSRYGKVKLEYERNGVLAVSSIYGIDILEDNVQECRDRLFNIFNQKYTVLLQI